ncbi:hypothetical protein AAZX31_13G073600 [Glycine max]|nr:hypothetical protein JHK87_035662 [Glycine soja]
MTKNEMHIIGIVIMIMIVMDFSQANYNPSFGQIERNHVSNLACEDKCRLKCAFLLIPPFTPGYLICLYKCMATNCKANPIVQDCKSGCGLTKSVSVNDDAHGVAAADVVDSCLQECQK